jgi:hypothetical protein
MPTYFSKWLGSSFINNIGQILTTHFLFLLTSSNPTYYAQGKGKVESTTKVIGTLMTKLIIEKHNYWEKYLNIIMHAY